MADSDHYIPRFLTRPWQRGNGHLRYFDFRTRTFGMKKAKKLFAARGLNDRETEQFLCKYVENPVAVFQDRLCKADDPEVVFNQAPLSALTALFWYQAQRLQDFRDKRSGQRTGPSRMQLLAKRGAQYLDQLAAAFWESDEPLLLCAGADEVIFFPESCFVVMPTLGDRPVLALPMSPRLLVAFVDRSANRGQILTNLRLRGRMTALSLGVSRRFDRVIIPPTIEDPPVDVLSRIRGAARSVFSIQASARSAVGLPAWHLHE